MPNDINHLDANDEGLKAIFGDRFHDETTEKPEAAKTTRKQNPAKAVKAPAIEPKTEPASYKDAKWNPVKPDPNWLDKLKACAMYTVGFGGLSILLFSWQQAGLMDSSVAIPSMCVCTALAGFGVGKNALKGSR
jgi:hypothetical protein